MAITYRDEQNHLITIAAISGNTSGVNEIVAAVAGKKIYVTKLFFTADANSVKVKFQSGSNDITGLINLATAGNGFQFLADEYPHLVTNAGEALNMNLNAAVYVTGWLHYYTE